ncbi:hypothetical protein BJX63DRAFT_395427 [Aspergillus granulosus]|uniref:Zn(2)-C6 fungal-type domain-containing protein n=1 Tax=Aspergillus granulosus TaxID=176169 RepID=A0ABR4HC42_9EURO
MMQPVFLKYTTQSCLSCRSKKRKCDKRMPACSRCQHSKQHCLYGNGSLGLYGSIVPITGGDALNAENHLALGAPPKRPPLKPLRACYRCRHAKKQCDKAHPSCSRCLRIGASCVYDHLPELELLRTHHSFSYGPTTTITEYRPTYPIDYHDHIPMLLRFFQDKMGLLSFQVETFALATYLRSSWIRSALSDPCLFHATLFSASVQLDALTGIDRPNYATLYHQSNTVKLVRYRLTVSNDLDDVTVASVLLLALHGSLQFDRESTEIHQQGLLKMIATRGGLDKLGFGGFLAEITQNAITFLAIIFDQSDPFPIPEWGAAPVLPHNLIFLVLEGSNKSQNETVRLYLRGLFQDIKQLLYEAGSEQNMFTMTSFSVSQLRCLLDKLWSRCDPVLDKQTSTLSGKELALLRTCSISGRILAYLLDDRMPWSEQKMAWYLSTLEGAIDATERATWIKHAPEAILWIAVIGAAMSKDLNGRKSWVLKEKCVASSIRSTQPSLHVRSWFCY